jgi:hypothetical protein
MKSYVYFIYDSDNKLVKIGKANNIKQRFSSIISGNPFNLTIVKTIECESEEKAFELEKELHSKYQNDNFNREWFEANRVIKEEEIELDSDYDSPIKVKIDVDTPINMYEHIPPNVKLVGSIRYNELNISEFIIISVNPQKISYGMVQKRLIKGGKNAVKNPTSFYFSKKINKASFKVLTEEHSFKNIVEDNDSINSTFDKKSVSIAFSDVVNPGVTQSFGRFRNNLTQLILVGININKETVMKQFKETDPYLYEKIENKTIFIEANGMADINKHSIIERKLQTENTKGKSIGQNISQKTIDKKQSIIDFSKTIDIKKYQTKVQLLNDYISYCSDNDLPPVSKNTLFKELPLPSKEKIALYNATYFKTKTHANGADYKNNDEWFAYYVKYCKKNKLKVTTKEIFINIKL